jgi:phosphohistidine phosphatase
MKRIIFVRHGKSSWDTPVDDSKRPLKIRAYKDAEHVISAFKSYKYFPVEVFTSHAKRALTTAELFKKGLHIEDNHFHIKPELYTFNANDVLSFISNIKDEHETVMLFGHNPAYTELVNSLGNLPIQNLPTTGLVSILFEIDSWKQVQSGQTNLYLFPKHLR